MNKTVLILLLAFCCVSATTQWGGGYGNYGGYGGYSNGRWTGGYTGGWGNYGGYTGDINGNVDADWTGAQDAFTGNLGDAVSAGNGGVYSCQDAIEKVNGAFEQLVEDVTGQVNEWIVYSDLDAVDEVSYYLGGACDVKQLDVVTQGSPACRGLGQLLKAVVQQGESGSFRGDYQQGAQLSEQALSLGQGVEKGCQVRVVKKQQQQPRPQAPQQAKQVQQVNNEEEANEQEEQVERQQTQRKVQQDNFIVRSEKTKTAKHGKQGEHTHKGFASTWGNWGQNYGSQYVGQNAGGQKQQKGSQDVNQYGKQYESQYGGKYSSEGKDMTKLGSPGEGKKYGTGQADLSHKINQEYTEKYGKKNEYQEKYQKNNEEENNVESGEGLAFNLDDYMVWM